MFDAKSVSRALLLTAVVAVAAAPAASAREADAPVHQGHAVVVTAPVPGTPTSVPPRVDGIGQQPTDGAGRVATPNVQAPSHDGFDWTLAAVIAAALLSVVLLGVAGWTTRSRRVAS